MENLEIKKQVLDNYSKIAEKQLSHQDLDRDCGCAPGCCGGDVADNQLSKSQKIGYDSVELQGIPEDADMGLGCGNPLVFAQIKEGDTILDLGSGGGIDCFLAAPMVGASGRVIGVDMSPDMIHLARQNVVKTNHENVEFRLGEIENLPVADETVNLIISNCVINLSTQKELVFQDAFRVLKSGGKIAISDIIALQELPEKLKNDIASYVGCMSGAITDGELRALLESAGFTSIKVEFKEESKSLIKDWGKLENLADYVISANIEAIKPLK